MTNSKKLSTGTKIAYGIGDFASQLVWTFAGNYLTIFYTDIVGLAPAIASAIMLIARIWDGINDPMFGAIAERTQTKWGHFRPYILFGAPFLALFNVLTFTAPFGHGTGGVVWASFSYIMLGMLYTVVNLSYGSLSNVMTTDPQERIELNSWRMIGTNVGACFLSAISMPLIMKFSGGAGATVTSKGYIFTTTIFAICSLPLFFLLFKCCKEVVRPVRDVKQFSVWKSFAIVLTNKPLLMIFFTLLFYMTALFGRIGLCIYYFIYNMKRFDLIALLMMAPSLCAAISIFLTRKLVNYFPKKTLGCLSLVGCGIALIAFYVTPFSDTTMIIIWTAVFGLFMFGTPLFMGSVPECIDYQELNTGIRSDGISYAFTSLATKFGSAFGASVGLMIMARCGYVANAKQSVEALKGINFAVNLFPAILFFVALIPWILYPLNEAKSREIRAKLEQKAAEGQQTVLEA
jgi:sugar (glycoside-pentoside-hexuronide) transporter